MNERITESDDSEGRQRSLMFDSTSVSSFNALLFILHLVNRFVWVVRRRVLTSFNAFARWKSFSVKTDAQIVVTMPF